MTLHFLIRSFQLPKKLGALGVLAVLIGSPRPALAELKVTVSTPVTGRYESVQIVVQDPQKGLDAKPGPLPVTMADSADFHQTVYLEPTGQPGEWSGRFTPRTVGRYTGSVMLERAGSKDIGLVPLIVVKPSQRTGFLRGFHPGQRVLWFETGGWFFPVGVRFSAEDLRGPIDWHTELNKLRARSVNFVEIPVEWPEGRTDDEVRAAAAKVDALLMEIERSGGIAVALRLEGPQDVAADPSAYEQQLQRWVRRWNFSKNIAAFILAGAGETLPSETCTRLVRAVRSADPYGHLLAIPSTSGEPRGGAELAVAPSNWQRPAIRSALLEATDTGEMPTPLPGETTWQMLTLGGVGLPIQPYRPGAAESAALLRLSSLAAAMRTVPYGSPARPLSGVVPVDTPGSFCLYGNTIVGWYAPEPAHELLLRSLPKGRFKARFWDPTSSLPRGEDVFLSDGHESRIRVPDAKTLFVAIEPAAQQPAPMPVAKPAPPKPKPAVVHAAPKPKTAPKTTTRVTYVRRHGRRVRVVETVPVATSRSRRSRTQAEPSRSARRRKGAAKTASKKKSAAKPAPKKKKKRRTG